MIFFNAHQRHNKEERAVQVRRERQKASKKGWTNQGCLSPIYLGDQPSRQQAIWNKKEDNDLIDAYRAGATISQLSFIHFRKFNAIEIRLHRLGVS